MTYHIICKNILLEKDDKLLLWDNIFLKNSKYVKKNKTIGNYFYPVIFDAYINNTTLSIISKCNIKDICSINEKISVKYNCCICINDFCYNYFLEKFNDEFKKKIIKICVKIWLSKKV